MASSTPTSSIKKQLDVVFVHPNAAKAIYQSLSFDLKAVEPPIWAAMLANHTRHHHFHTEIIDAEALNLSIEETVEQIHERRPRLVVIVVYGLQPSASTQTMYGASLLCTSLKQTYPHYKILMVGGHVSALPERTLNEESADFVCQGEGPSTIDHLLAANMDDPLQLRKVPGLWFKEKGIPTFTQGAPLISQSQLQHQLPGMAWDLLPLEKYKAHNWHCFDSLEAASGTEIRRPYISMYTSLGCPFRCSFCCINSPFGKPSFRYWDPAFIVSQIENLVERYGVKNIKFADEMFVLKEEHFLKICQLLIEKKLQLNIWAYTRVDTVKERHLDILKKAGVNWLVVGIESAGQYVRDGVRKGSFTEGDIYKSIKRIQAAGINVLGNFIFGLPEDTQESMKSTLDMSLELSCEFANFYSAMAYPGSPLYQMAIQKNWRLPESWLGYSQHSMETLPLPTETLSAGEVLGFRDFAWKYYFTSPRYQNFVKDKFGLQALKHIDYMTSIPLQRKYSTSSPSLFK